MQRTLSWPLMGEACFSAPLLVDGAGSHLSAKAHQAISCAMSDRCVQKTATCKRRRPSYCHHDAVTTHASRVMSWAGTRVTSTLRTRAGLDDRVRALDGGRIHDPHEPVERPAAEEPGLLVDRRVAAAGVDSGRLRASPHGRLRGVPNAACQLQVCQRYSVR